MLRRVKDPQHMGLIRSESHLAAASEAVSPLNDHRMEGRVSTIPSGDTNGGEGGIRTPDTGFASVTA